MGITHYSCLFSCEKTAEYQGLPITFMNINLTFAYSELGFFALQVTPFYLKNESLLLHLWEVQCTIQTVFFTHCLPNVQ